MRRRSNLQQKVCVDHVLINRSGAVQEIRLRAKLARDGIVKVLRARIHAQPMAR